MSARICRMQLSFQFSTDRSSLPDRVASAQIVKWAGIRHRRAPRDVVTAHRATTLSRARLPGAAAARRRKARPGRRPRRSVRPGLDPSKSPSGRQLAPALVFTVTAGDYSSVNAESTMSEEEAVPDAVAGAAEAGATTGVVSEDQVKLA